MDASIRHDNITNEVDSSMNLNDSIIALSIFLSPNTRYSTIPSTNALKCTSNLSNRNADRSITDLGEWIWKLSSMSNATSNNQLNSVVIDENIPIANS